MSSLWSFFGVSVSSNLKNWFTRWIEIISLEYGWVIGEVIASRFHCYRRINTTGLFVALTNYLH